MKLSFKNTLISLVVVITVSGCAGNPVLNDIKSGIGKINLPSTNSNTNNNKKTSKKDKLAKDQQRTKNEAMVAGVIGGAILGKVAGGKTKHMILGAGLGLVAGVVIGNKIANLKKSNAKAQDKLDGQIALLNQSIGNTKKQISNSQQYRKLIKLKISSSQGDKKARAALLQDMNAVINQKRKVVASQKKDLNEHKSLIQHARKQALQQKTHVNTRSNDNKVSLLQREINILEKEINNLAKMKVNMQAQMG